MNVRVRLQAEGMPGALSPLSVFASAAAEHGSCCQAAQEILLEKTSSVRCERAKRDEPLPRPDGVSIPDLTLQVKQLRSARAYLVPRCPKSPRSAQDALVSRAQLIPTCARSLSRSSHFGFSAASLSLILTHIAALYDQYVCSYAHYCRSAQACCRAKGPYEPLAPPNPTRRDRQTRHRLQTRVP